jgi:phosphonate C-P lyase system protein PhnG
MKQLNPDIIPPRSQWGRFLMALPAKRVVDLSEHFVSEGKWQVDRISREGLRLLPLQESTRGELFHLGEVPLTEIRVILKNPEGKELEGGATLLDAAQDQVEAIAVLDALLSASVHGAERIALFLEEGQAVCAGIERERAYMRSRTRVDFSLLSDAEEETKP